MRLASREGAVARKSLIALLTVGVLVSIFALRLVSAVQLLKPHGALVEV